jgi:hypothetical protein
MDILNNNFVLGMVIANRLPRREALLVGLAAGQIPPSSGMGPVLLKPIVDSQIRLRTERDAAVAQRTVLEERIRMLEQRLVGKGNADDLEDEDEEDEEDEEEAEARAGGAQGGGPAAPSPRRQARPRNRKRISARATERERKRQTASEGITGQNEANGLTDSEARARLSGSDTPGQTNS